MYDSDSDSRKKHRRKKIEDKFSLDRRNFIQESKDIKKLNKQFKKQRESITEDERWEDWMDEIS